MPIKQPHISAVFIAAVLIGLAVLWLQPVRAEQAVTVPVQPRTVTVPVLMLILSPHEKVLNAGGSVQIDALITNTGDGTATGVVLTVSAPDGIVFGSSKKKSASWNIPTLPAGNTQTVTFSVKASTTMQSGNAMLRASVIADSVAAVSATSVIALQRGQVKGATTDGIETLTELPKTGTTAVPLWVGGALVAAGLAGLHHMRRSRVRVG